MQVMTIGVDLAKHIFQLHGVDAQGHVVLRRRVRRANLLAFFRELPPCLVGLEACGTAHHWARQLGALGHTVRLMSPAYVKPYVKRQKNDMADAEAICEAVARPSMRFVPIKSEAQQSVILLHRSRDLLIRQRTMLVNAIRGHLAEFGIVAAQGTAGFAALLRLIRAEEHDAIPGSARDTLAVLGEHLLALQERIARLEREILAIHREDAVSRRLATIPGIGPITASAMAATITEPALFASGRQLAAWLGLVPRQSSSGGKERLGRITKQGDPYIRRLLITGASAVLRYARQRTAAASGWLQELLARRPAKVAAVALANKTARIAWALLARGDVYRPPTVAAA